MRRYIYKKIHYLIFDLDLGVKVTQNVAQYPLHYVTFSATKFEVAASKGFGGEAFTRKFNIWPLTLGQGHTKCWPVPSTSCDLFSCKVWSSYVKPFRRRYNYKKIQYLTFDLDLGVKVKQNVAQYPLHHVTYSTTKFKVATSNGLGVDTFTRNVTDGRTHGRTDGQTDGRRTDFDTKLIYPFFLKKKAGIKMCHIICL